MVGDKKSYVTTLNPKRIIEINDSNSRISDKLHIVYKNEKDEFVSAPRHIIHKELNLQTDIEVIGAIKRKKIIFSNSGRIYTI